MEDNTITINGTDYNVADLSEELVALINRVTALRHRIVEAKNSITELDILVGVYSEQVLTSLAELDGAPAQEEMSV